MRSATLRRPTGLIAQISAKSDRRLNGRAAAARVLAETRSAYTAASISKPTAADAFAFRHFQTLSWLGSPLNFCHHVRVSGGIQMASSSFEASSLAALSSRSLLSNICNRVRYRVELIAAAYSLSDTLVSRYLDAAAATQSSSRRRSSVLKIVSTSAVFGP